jgi:hypothetical protein
MRERRERADRVQRQRGEHEPAEVGARHGSPWGARTRADEDRRGERDREHELPRD